MGSKYHLRGPDGDDAGAKEPVYVNIMTRVLGVSHLDFILARGISENAPKWFVWRTKLVTDIAKYTWIFNSVGTQAFNALQIFCFCLEKPTTARRGSSRRYPPSARARSAALARLTARALSQSYPNTILMILAIFSLPMVLVHEDFGSCNVMVDSAS